MRVLCLQNDDDNCFDCGEPLVIGEVYNAIDEIIGYGKDDTPTQCYILAEIPPECGYPICFPCDWFVPLSDDAEETEEEVKKKEEVFA